MFKLKPWWNRSVGVGTQVAWELCIDRQSIQNRDDLIRTVGRYQVLHAGVPQPHLCGTSVEIGGPGDNTRLGNRRRIEAGTYPLATQKGLSYATLGYVINDDPAQRPKPGLALLRTGKRKGIIIHQGSGFIMSIGCINLAGILADTDQDICQVDSRDRVVALITDLTRFFGSSFPRGNGRRIRNAQVVICGEP